MTDRMEVTTKKGALSPEKIIFGVYLHSVRHEITVSGSPRQGWLELQYQNDIKSALGTLQGGDNRPRTIKAHLTEIYNKTNPQGASHALPRPDGRHGRAPGPLNAWELQNIIVSSPSKGARC